MLGHSTTISDTTQSLHAVGQLEPVPGLVVIFANGRPRQRVFRWEGAPLELGRQELMEDDVVDPLISRRHTRFEFQAGSWHVRDLQSRNGTYVAGKLTAGDVAVVPGSTVRVGGSIFLPRANILDFDRSGLGVRDRIVVGPSLRRALEAIALARSSGLLTSLLISGESGSGKEIAAKAFHDAGGQPHAPFVALNCATLPKDLAERLLFGARRGAFSGATDAQGYVQAAHGGTLFLDEIAELPLDVQSKLLRMLETREVLRLGATSPERVDVHICAATWRDLRQEVAAGRFREDLYFRIGQPEIRLPPLRERTEELPWHIHQVLSESGASKVGVTAAFVDACAARHWPGNVRELRAEVRRAAALACNRVPCLLGADDLAESAGKPIAGGTGVVSASAVHSAAAGSSGEASASPRVAAAFPSDEIAEALASEQGNVASAARRLGIHRNRIRRWLERYGVDAQRFKA